MLRDKIIVRNEKDVTIGFDLKSPANHAVFENAQSLNESRSFIS